MIDELKNIPSKVNLEQFDIANFAKEKIREMFRGGLVPTSEAMVEEIILRALKKGAADVHFEPVDRELRIRLGVEGVMQKLVLLPIEIAENIASILKTKASLNVFEKRKPQEGRFTIKYGALQFDCRVSTMPILDGERIVVHILQKNARVARIEELGFAPEMLAALRALLQRPSGLVLVTGAAGSGKSTTVYAAVNDIQALVKNIITVENPVEYRLDFASQVPTPADGSFTIVEALRSILRQSPNIIMIGEIRDAETGTVAAEAAITGNLVLSTMLSTDALGGILRLLHLGVPPYYVATTLSGVVYQKLVRRICDSCKESYLPSADSVPPSFAATLPQGSTLFRGKGCDACGGTGYHGRAAIMELLSINAQLKDLVHNQASPMQLKEAAAATGFQPIQRDALRKLLAGTIAVDGYVEALG